MSTDTAYSHTMLTAGSTRHYRVSAINSIGTGTASTVVMETSGSVIACSTDAMTDPIWTGNVTVRDLGINQFVGYNDEVDGSALDVKTFTIDIASNDLNPWSGGRRQWPATGLPITTYVHKDRAENLPAGYEFARGAKNAAGGEGPESRSSVTPVRYWFELTPRGLLANTEPPSIEEGENAEFRLARLDDSGNADCVATFPAGLNWSASDPGGYLDAASGGVDMVACQASGDFTVATDVDSENEAEDGAVTISLASVSNGSIALFVGNPAPSVCSTRSPTKP